MKKILFIQHSPNLGGAPKSLSLVINNKPKEENLNLELLILGKGPAHSLFKNTKIYTSNKIRPMHGSTVSGSSIYYLLKTYLAFPYQLYLCYKSLKKLNPSIIYLNSSCLFGFGIAAKIFNPKIIVISHLREPILKGIFGWHLRFGTRRFSDRIIANSQHDLASLNNSNKPTKVVYNSAPSLSEFEVDNRIKHKKLTLLYLARFSEGNGWQELISWMEELNKFYKDRLHLIMAGCPEKLMRKLKPSNNIEILPFQKDIDALMRRSDVFVCPFTKPHFSRGIIEAAHYKVPALGRNIGCINELIDNKKTGLLFKNKQDFRISIEYLLTNPLELKRMSLNAYKKANKHFSEKINNEKIWNFILS